jgi:hypothetical protein
MNHGGLGYVDEKKIVLPIDLLRPLSIYDGSFVEAMYYPRPASHGRAKGVNNYADFMITPVARYLWPTTAHLIIRICHVPGTLQKVAEFLASQQISILNAECSRSAHRYATWNMTVAFTNLKLNQFDAASSEHMGTRDALDAILGKIVKRFQGKNVLFTDASDGALKYPVEGFLIRTNSYFHEQLEAREQAAARGRGCTVLDRPFKLHCRGFELVDHEEKLKQLLYQMPNRAGLPTGPSCVFAEMNTRDMSIRAAYIPPRFLPFFWEIRLQYLRKECHGIDSSVGFLAKLMNRIPPRRYNLWRVSNHTRRNVDNSEVGEIVIYLEDLMQTDHNDTRVQIETLCISIEHEFGANNNIEVVRHQALPVTSTRILHQLGEEQRRFTGIAFDAFVSYDTQHRDSADLLARGLEKHGIKTHLAHRENQAGIEWRQAIVESIRTSREFIVCCTPGIKDRGWVNFELGCALAYGKYITPVMMGANVKALPESIAGRHVLKAEGDYIKELASMIYARSAMHHAGY